MNGKSPNSAQPLLPPEMVALCAKEICGIEALPTIEEVERLIGVPRGKSSSGKILRQIELSVEKAKELLDPKWHYRIYPSPDAGKGGVFEIEQAPLKSHKLKKTLSGSEYVVIFAVTIGKDIEREIEALSVAGKHFDAHVLDAAASAAVEALADSFQNRFDEELLDSALCTSLRFSPGYCDWEITGQESVFTLLGGEPAGISLLSLCLMTPRKSVTGVFGIVALDPWAGSQRGKTTPCTTCAMQGKCRVRRL